MGFDIYQGLNIEPTFVKAFPRDGYRVLLLDADFIPYAVCYHKEEAGTLDAFTRIKLKFERVSNIISDAMVKADADAVILFMSSSKENFRYEYMPDYKGNRKAEKPEHWQEVRDFIQTQYAANVELSDNNEADDVVSIFMNNQMAILDADDVPRTPQAYRDFCPYIIGSPDKDLNQVFGWHVDLNTGRHYFVDELGKLDPVWKEEFKEGKMYKRLKKLNGTGAKFFWAQLIMGDPVDGFKGIPRKGAADAFKTLDKCKTELECMEAVINSYKNYFDTEWREQLLQQGRMAYLQRQVGEIWGDCLTTEESV